MTRETPPLVGITGLLASPAVTAALLSTLALLAAAGTLVPADALRSWVLALPPALRALAHWLELGDWYRSIPFRFLGALLLFQILFCSLQRTVRGTANLLSGGALPGNLSTVVLPVPDAEGIRQRLAALGYRQAPGGKGRYRRNAWWALRGSVVHLSVATAMIGASVAGLSGTIGTTWAPEGEPIATIQDRDGRWLALPFTLKVDRVTERYPMRFRIGLLWKETGVKEAPVELASGETVPLPGTPLTIEVLRAASDLRSADILVREGEREVAVLRAGPDHPFSPLPFDLFVVATKGRREPEWYGVTGTAGGRGEERRVDFGANAPLTIAGYTVSLTAYRRGDGAEPWVAGLQVASSPGLGVVAAASLLLTAALLAFLVPVREARIITSGGELRLLLRGSAPRPRLLSEAEIIVRGASA